jgi:hypothetical protein
MRLKRIALLVLAFAVCAVTLPLSVFSADQKTIDEMVLAAFREEKTSGSSGRVAEKFKALLKVDPDNYFALIKLGAMTSQSVQGSGQDKKAMAEAVDYFLRATLSQPQNPEAYLYLAELYYKFGYIAEGDSYARMAKTLSRYVVYDSVCLTGSRYEDAGNFHAAVMTYAPVALSDASQFKNDPYLLKRLFKAASSAPPPYDWVYRVAAEKFGEKRSLQEIDAYRKVLNALIGHWSMMASKDHIEDFLKMLLREILLQQLSDLEKSVTRGMEIPDTHEMPSVLYKHFFCNPEEIAANPFADPYEAFVKASFDSAQEQTRVLSELRGLRDEAVKVVAEEQNEVGRAKKLFTWLKKRALVEYDVMDGFSAKGVVDDKKFLCLSGAIVYTLLARDAKLNVCGVMEPGHAYASLSTDRKIRIETTVDASEGFDYKREVSDRVLQLGPFATYGEIAEPMKFVAYQFGNTASFSLDDLILNKYEKLLRRHLKETRHFDEAKQTDYIAMCKKQGLENRRPLMMGMAAADDRFRADCIKQLDKNVELLKTARAISPFDLENRDRIRTSIMQAAVLESLPAVVAENERGLKRMKLQLKKDGASRRSQIARPKDPKQPKGTPEEQEVDTAGIDAELEQLNQEAEENWEAEKKFWLKTVKRLSNAAKDFPCDEKLQNSLARSVSIVQELGTGRRDRAIMEDLRPYGTGRQY